MHEISVVPKKIMAWPNVQTQWACISAELFDYGSKNNRTILVKLDLKIAL